MPVQFYPKFKIFFSPLWFGTRQQFIMFNTRGGKVIYSSLLLKVTNDKSAQMTAICLMFHAVSQLCWEQVVLLSKLNFVLLHQSFASPDGLKYGATVNFCLL